MLTGSVFFNCSLSDWLTIHGDFIFCVASLSLLPPPSTAGSKDSSSFLMVLVVGYSVSKEDWSSLLAGVITVVSIWSGVKADIQTSCTTSWTSASTWSSDARTPKASCILLDATTPAPSTSAWTSISSAWAKNEVSWTWPSIWSDVRTSAPWASALASWTTSTSGCVWI